MSKNEQFPLALPEGSILAGQYIIEKVLGQGGFGITYRANDYKTGQNVAVKEFFPDTLAYREATTVISHPGERSENFAYGKEGFLQEAQTLATFIGNENIVRIHSYFEENGTAYFVMDYIEGISFDEYLKNRGGKISCEEAKQILVPVMDALEAVHSKGIVHRDVTPDNIYITNDGTVKLLDFGAARYSLGDKSRSLDIILKHGFAPKEQYTRHGKQGPYTDIYSLGATFYFAITGKRPPDSVDRLDEDDLIPPSNLGVQITDYQEKAILQAMSVQPSERFESMAVFKQVLLNESAPVQNNTTNQMFFNTPQIPPQPAAPVVQSSVGVTQAVQSPVGVTQTIQSSIGVTQAVQPVQPEADVTQTVQLTQKKKSKKPLFIGIAAAAVVCIGAAIAVGAGVGSSSNDDIGFIESDETSVSESGGVLSANLDEIPASMTSEADEKAKLVNTAVASALTQAGIAGVSSNYIPYYLVIDSSSESTINTRIGTYDVDFSDYLGEDYVGTSYTVIDSDTYTAVYSLWSEDPIPREYKHYLTAEEQESLANSGIIIGCYTNVYAEAKLSEFDVNVKRSDAYANAKLINTAVATALTQANAVGVQSSDVPSSLVIDSSDPSTLNTNIGSYSVNFIDYLGINYVGTSYTVIDSSRYAAVYSLWSESPIPEEYKRQLTAEEQETLANNGIFIGCFPVLKEGDTTAATAKAPASGSSSNAAGDLQIIGNLPQNLRNGGYVCDAGDDIFWIDEGHHSVQSIKKGYIKQNSSGYYTDLSYIDGYLYYLYNSKAYMYNVSDKSEKLVPELESYDHIDTLYISKLYFYVVEEYDRSISGNKLHLVSRKTGKTEKTTVIDDIDKISFYGEWIYLAVAKDDGKGKLFRYKADLSDLEDENVNSVNLKYQVTYLTADNGYVYMLLEVDSSQYIVRFSSDLVDTSGDVDWDISSVIDMPESLAGMYNFNIYGRNAFITVCDWNTGIYTLYHITLNDDGTVDSSVSGKIVDDVEFGTGISWNNILTSGTDECVIHYCTKNNDGMYYTTFDADGNAIK